MNNSSKKSQPSHDTATNQSINDVIQPYIDDLTALRNLRIRYTKINLVAKELNVAKGLKSCLIEDTTEELLEHLTVCVSEIKYLTVEALRSNTFQKEDTFIDDLLKTCYNDLGMLNDLKQRYLNDAKGLDKGMMEDGIENIDDTISEICYLAAYKLGNKYYFGEEIEP